MAIKFRIVTEEFEGKDAQQNAEHHLEELVQKGWRIVNVRVTYLVPDGVRIEALMDKSSP